MSLIKQFHELLVQFKLLLYNMDVERQETKKKKIKLFSYLLKFLETTKSRELLLNKN